MRWTGPHGPVHRGTKGPRTRPNARSGPVRSGCADGIRRPRARTARQDGRAGTTLWTRAGRPAREICVALARAEVKDSVLEEYCDLAEAPEEYAWLGDAEHDVRYGALPRNDRVEFDAIERVDRLREHPHERGT